MPTIPNLPTTHSDGIAEVISASIVNDIARDLNALYVPGFVQLPTGWNTVWTAAKAAAPASPVWVTGIGDSIMQGANSSNFLTNSWWAKVRAWLLATYPGYADFLGLAESVSGAPTYPITPPWVMNTAPTSFSLIGYADAPLWNSVITATPMATLVTPEACTRIDLIYQNAYAAGASTWTYTIDGGATQTVTLAAASRQVYREQITGLANTTHTIVINGQSAANACICYGAVAYKSTTLGMGFAKCARQGQVASYFISDNAGQPINRSAIFQGYTTTSQNDTGFGFPAQPHLAIISLGINDCTGAYSAKAVQFALVALIRALRRGRDNCSIIILACNNPDGVNSDVTSNLFGNPTFWPYYLEVMQDVARNFNCAYINIHAKWGELGVAKGFQVSNNAHPTDAGHTDIATLLEAIL